MSEISTPAGAAPFWDRVRTALLDLHPQGGERGEAEAGAGGWLRQRKLATAPGQEGRRPLREALEAGWALCAERKVSLSMLIVEIDAFNAFRSDYGPLRAESLRTGVEQMAAWGAPRSASFLGRHGIGRLAVVAPDCPILLARAAANRIGAEVMGSGAALSGGEHGLASVSIGVATINPSGVYSAALLDGAERALFKARERGHGRIEAMDLRGNRQDRLAAV